MSERPSALLTKTQRDYLRGSRESKGPEHDRALRSRLRTRVYEGLNDGTILWSHLDPEEIEKIFAAWEDADEDLDEREQEQMKEFLPSFGDADEQERQSFERALIGLVAFIYTGTKASGNLDAETILTTGVEHAERVQGNEVSAEIDISERFDTEELLKRFHNGDPALTGADLAHLKSAVKEIGPEETNDYYNNALASTPNLEGGMLSGEEVRNLFRKHGADIPEKLAEKDILAIGDALAKAFTESDAPTVEEVSKMSGFDVDTVEQALTIYSDSVAKRVSASNLLGLSPRGLALEYSENNGTRIHPVGAEK